MDLFKLLGTIAIENGDAIQALKDTSTEGSNTESKLSTAFSKVGSAAVTVGKTMATGLAVGATAMAGLTAKALNLSGELEQNMGGSEAVFGEYAEKMQDTAKEAFSNMGLSTSDFLATANKMGALFQGTGFTIEESSDLSAEAMQRAADVASIMGLDVSAAMEAVAGAAKGNYTMMDNLGVAMNETTLEAYAVSKGLTKVGEGSVDLEKLADAQDKVKNKQIDLQSKQLAYNDAVAKYGEGSSQAQQAAFKLEKAENDLAAAQRKVTEAQAAGNEETVSWYQNATQQEKVALAMEMFLEKTAYAAGNYAKENETLAGSLTTAKAALTNFLDGSGDVEGLISSFSNLADVVIKNISEIAPRLVTGLSEVIQQAAPLLPPLLQKLLPVILDGAKNLIISLVSLLPSVLQILTDELLPAAISAIVSIFDSLVSALPSLISTLVSALPSLVPLLVSGLVSMIVTLCSNFSAIIQPIIDFLPDLIIILVNSLMSNLPILIQGALDLCLGIVAAIPQIIQSLVDATPTIIESLVVGILNCLPQLLLGIGQLIWGVVQALPTLLFSPIEVIINTLIGLWEGVKNVFAPAAQWFNTNVVQPVVKFFQKLGADMKIVWDKICEAVSFSLELIGAILSAAFQIITLPFRFIWENCKEYVFQAWEWIKEKVSAAILFVKDTISRVMTEIANFLSPILSKIKNAFSEAWQWIREKVTSAVNAVRDKATSVMSAARDKLSSIVTGIKDKFVSAFTAVRDKVSDLFGKTREKMVSPIEKARDLIKTAVDKIKGFFSNLSLKFPNIKLPHFSVSPSGWKIGDLLKGTIPSLSIDWYAKAMKNPIVMTKPTIWGYDPATGNLQGGGETGTEVVSGAATLMGMIRGAVASQNEPLVYLVQQLIDMLAEYFPEALQAMREAGAFDPDGVAKRLARPMNRELGKLATVGERGR